MTAPDRATVTEALASQMFENWCGCDPATPVGSQHAGYALTPVVINLMEQYAADRVLEATKGCTCASAKD